jgi:DNA-binding PadR family transcriptional regulator
MIPAEEPVLPLHEWIVLSLVREGTTHGSALVNLLGHDGDIGGIWYVPKSAVYRSLDRLTDLGLLTPAGEEPAERGPIRYLVKITRAGRTAVESWRHRPVQHTRDIRSELLVKLALLYRSGADPHDLLAAQRALLVPIADALRDRAACATGFDRTLMLWRYETASATIRFLDALLLPPR